MKVSWGTRIVLDNEGAVTIGYVVKLLCFWVHMDFNTNLFRRPTWLAHSSVILHTNCRQKFESYTKTTWYVTRTVRKPLETTKLLPALPGRFTLTWARAQKHERTNYWIEYLKINFLRCLHAETSSLRLFNVASSGLVMIKCFSAVHSWHLPVRFVYGFAFSRIFQPIVYRSFLLFSAQMCLLSSVLFLLFSLLKDAWWFLHLALKLVAVNPT